MNEHDAILSIQPMLRKITRHFADKSGMCAEELFLEMQLVALAAVRTHNPGKRTLVSWMYLLVNRQLNRRAKFPGFHEKFDKHDCELSKLLPFIHNKQRFSLPALLFEVSEDAALAIQLAIQEGIEDRSYIESVLYSSFGWTQQQINRVFAEIQEAIS